MARITCYHGTASPPFDRFRVGPSGDAGSGHNSARLGVFLTGCPRIAATFALKPDVIDKGYDTMAGSRSLLRNPYAFDEDPFLPDAAVLTCEADLGHAFPISASAWCDLVDAAACGEPDPFGPLLAGARAAGCDHIAIARALPGERDSLGCRPSMEYDAETWVVFDPAAVAIVAREPAAEHLPRPAPLNIVAHRLSPSG